MLSSATIFIKFVKVHSTAETPKLESPLIENPSVNQWIDSEPELKKDQLADLGIVDDDDDVIVDEVEKEDEEVGDEEVGDKRREDEELTASLVEEEKFDDFDNEEIPPKESCNLLKTMENK